MDPRYLTVTATNTTLTCTGLVYFRNSQTQGNADSQFIFEDPGDILVAGDWDGDGDDTVAAYRKENGTLYVSSPIQRG
jgi:hypothetical protein